MKNSKCISVVYLTFSLILILSSCSESKSQLTNEKITEQTTIHELPKKEQVDSVNEQAQKLITLKDGDTDLLVGFNFGDPIDYDEVKSNGDYLNGGEIFILKNRENDDLFLFFEGESKGFSGLGAYEKGDFFGIILGQDTLQKAKDVLGEPDIFEEKSDVDGNPIAIYQFENAVLFIRMNIENKVTQITYKAE